MLLLKLFLVCVRFVVFVIISWFWWFVVICLLRLFVMVVISGDRVGGKDVDRVWSVLFVLVSVRLLSLVLSLVCSLFRKLLVRVVLLLVVIFRSFWFIWLVLVMSMVIRWVGLSVMSLMWCIWVLLKDGYWVRVIWFVSCESRWVVCESMLLRLIVCLRNFLIVVCWVGVRGWSLVRWLMKIWYFLLVGIWFEEVCGVVISFFFLSWVMLLWIVVVDMLNEWCLMMVFELIGLCEVM